jgi:hypothetical protein
MARNTHPIRDYGGALMTPQQHGYAKRKAREIGIPLQELLARRAAGEHWCSFCRTWKPADREHFQGSRDCWAGLGNRCTDCAALRMRLSRRQANGVPLDAPPRSGRRPTSDTPAARWQRERVAKMTLAQREAHYAQMRASSSARYRAKGWETVCRERRRRIEERARHQGQVEQERLDAARRALLAALCERAAQRRQLARALATPVGLRTIAQSALIVRAWLRREIDYCGYVPLLNGDE